MALRRRAVTAGVALCVLAGVVACGDDDESDSPGGSAAAGQEVLTCGTDPVYRPLAFYDEKGDLVGFDIDLCRAYAEKLGMKSEIKLYQFSGLIPALNAKQIDVEPEMSITEEREEEVSFTDPVVTQSTAAVVKKDRANFNPSTIEELEGLKVGVQSGTSADTVVSKYPKIPVTRYETQPDAFQDLVLGRTEVVVTGNLTGGYEVAHTYPDELRIAEKPITGGGLQERVNVGAAVRKDDAELLGRLNEAVKTMQEDGTLDRIVKKWFGDITYKPDGT